MDVVPFSPLEINKSDSATVISLYVKPSRRPQLPLRLGGGCIYRICAFAFMLICLTLFFFFFLITVLPYLHLKAVKPLVQGEVYFIYFLFLISDVDCHRERG